MHGDRVLVEVGPIRPDGRAEGRIVRPVMRAHSTVVGIFHHGNRGNYVTPTDQKISQEIVIPAGMDIQKNKGSAAGSPTVRKASHPNRGGDTVSERNPSIAFSARKPPAANGTILRA